MPCRICISIAVAIDTCPPVSAIIFQAALLSCVQWMYSLSAFIRPALPIISRPAVLPTTWLTIGAPTCLASAQVSGSRPPPIASVSS